MSAPPGILFVSQSGVTTLSVIPKDSLDGKLIRVTFAGISAGVAYHLKLNGSTILTFGVPAAGDTFFNEVVFTWNSTNQDITPETWIGGTTANLAGFNSDFTFSTDAGNTVTSFSVEAV